MADLLFSTDALEKLPMPDAEVYYLDTIELGGSSEEILHRLITETAWRQESVIVRGKRFAQPRLVAWYGDRGSAYRYSGVKLTPLPWTDLLLTIRRRVEEVAGSSFNSVLLNYYRDNRDSMGFHSDDEPELGGEPAIASVSLGDERTFVLKHKTRKFVKPVRLRLGSGSFLLMKGETQRYWKHGITKEAGFCGPRVNLTFRRIIALPGR